MQGELVVNTMQTWQPWGRCICWWHYNCTADLLDLSCPITTKGHDDELAAKSARLHILNF